MTKAAALDTELLDLVRRLLSFSAAALATTAGVLHDLDLTQTDAAVLWMLDPALDPPSLRELARRIGCDPSNVTLVCDRFESRGLARRRSHPTDGRSRVLTLTADGITARTGLLRRIVDTTPLGCLPPTAKRELSVILEFLEHPTPQS